MIIVPSSNDDKRQPPPSNVIEVSSDDPPPTYTEQLPPSTVPTESPVGTVTSQPTVKSSNYVSISRMNGLIKGSWVLDPALNLPLSLLPPLSAEETEETRRNLNLSTTNGSIDADITFAMLNQGSESKKLNRKRMTLHAKSLNGVVKAKLHCPDGPRLPFYLEVSASNGGINIHLPRSFHGPLVIKTWNGSPKFSPEITGHLTTFSDVNRTHKCFIGDYSGMSDDEQWQGDEIVVEARNGTVKLQYDNEGSDKGERKPGFFGKLFGF